MEKTIALDRDLDDVIFEQRNRAYGAYTLRKSYGNHIKKAGILGASLFLLLMSGPLIGERLSSNKAAMDDKNVIVEIKPPPVDAPVVPPPPPPPPPPKPQPQIQTQRFLPPVVMEDEKAKEEDIPRIENITAAVSNVTQEGEQRDLPPVIEAPAPPIEVPDVKEQPVDNTVREPFNVEQVPEFMDGMAAMYKFLNANIKYPSVARENGIQGTVYVGFVVWKDGSLRNVEVKRGVAGGCSEEAIRVVKLMPNWRPGKQNGKAVPVSFTIPIKFKLD